MTSSRSPFHTNVRLVESSAAQQRLDEARAFVERALPSGEVLLVGASRGSVDDLARSIASGARATVGLHRFSFTQVAVRLAGPVLAAGERAPVTWLASEAVAARAAFEADRDGALEYFAPVARTPGFAPALARTLQELRLAQVPGDALAALPLGGRDLATLLDRFDAQFASAAATDRALLFEAAVSALRSGVDEIVGLHAMPLVLLDVPIESQGEFDFAQALIGRRRARVDGEPAVLITVPFGDIATLKRWTSIGSSPDVLEQKGTSDLVALRRNLFAERQPPEREPAGDVRLFSAPGEAREAVEIARRVLQEAARGVRFDEMAVFLRAPQRYAGLVEHAFTRAGVPAYFERGTRRPHPAGRAFLALLACACERLSARRFAEYLSLAQVPRPEERTRKTPFVPPEEDVFPFAVSEADAETTPADAAAPAPEAADADDRAVLEGAIREPWRWESLIVESSVIGGDAERWRRRLRGLEQQYEIQWAAEWNNEPDSPKAAFIKRQHQNVRGLAEFALPVIETLASWPRTATWGDWLDRFAAFAPQVLRFPKRVSAVLDSLRPMSGIGPVSLDEVRAVLTERLLATEEDTPASRYGRVFVGSADHARGRVFRVVFVAGLAERLFPQRPHEDPMLLDMELRVPLAAGLATQTERVRAERLRLRLAAGAATERLWISYPRIETIESRPRVPSTYALDVMRAITGRVPKHEALQQTAAVEGGAGLAWPAPANARDAIDDLEHDLAVLKELLQQDPPAKVRGHAHYLLRLNENLKRSVSARWARARSQWTPFDGLTRVTGTTKPLLESQRLGARPYSLSALQKFASCPYQFLLSAICRLEPPQDIEPLQKLDPLMRGSIFHESQARFFRVLKDEGALPVTRERLSRALAVMEEAVTAVADEYAERLAPAIERVWRDEIADIARDLRVWVRTLPREDGWTPAYFEYAFGLQDANRDPASRREPVLVDDRFLLRGSVDVIERAAGKLRVTDHKTGRNRTTPKTVIGGGSILQPVLYSLAVERALEMPVVSGRLYYCTSAGGFVEREIPVNDANRRIALEALEIVDRAIELGFLPAAPDEKACAWCDFRPVCGPDEFQRTQRKNRDKLGDLEVLRARP